jgi:hypothetical protein
MEALYQKLFEADFTTPLEKFEAGCGIFQIDKYYKPKAKLLDTFEILLTI